MWCEIFCIVFYWNGLVIYGVIVLVGLIKIFKLGDIGYGLVNNWC